MLRNHQLKHSTGSAPRAFTLTAVFLLSIVTQSNLARADITNIAQAQGSYGVSTILSNNSSAAVPVVTANPSLLVTKAASPTSGVSAGQVITYTYTVKNDGNVTIQNVSLNDVHNAAGPAPTPAGETLSIDAGTLGDSTDVNPTDNIWSVLAPGDTITFTATYTVQQSDVDTLQ